MNKKFILTALSASMLVLIATSCGGNNEPNSFSALSKNQIKNYEAISSMNLLSTANSVSSLVKFDSDGEENDKQQTVIDEVLKKHLETSILPQADLIFTNGIEIKSNITTLEAGKGITINETEYLTVEKINYKNTFLEGVDIYTLVYNASNGPVEEVDEDDGEIEIYDNYDGFAYFGDLDIEKITTETDFHYFESTYEEETEGNKTEKERSMVLYNTESSFIKVTQENEVKNNKSETSFEYEMYNNGKLVMNYEIELETKNNKTSVGLTTNGVEYEISNHDSKNPNLYCVEVENGEKEEKYYFLKTEDGSFVYQTNSQPKNENSIV